MRQTTINERWTLILPDHRADREEWPVWEKPRLAAMHDAIQPGNVVFDIGAEEGDFTGLIAQWCGPDGGVVAFEPNPRVWPNLKAIWEANNLPAMRGWFVGFATNETVDAPITKDTAHWSTDKQRLADHQPWPTCADGDLIGDHGFCTVLERDDLPRITLDDFVSLTGVVPNVITMDVEGSELTVLEGSQNVLREHRPIVFVSVHEEILHYDFQSTAWRVHELMRNAGYVQLYLCTDHEGHFVYYPAESWDISPRRIADDEQRSTNKLDAGIASACCGDGACDNSAGVMNED